MKKLNTLLVLGLQMLPMLTLAQGGSGFTGEQPLPTGVRSFEGFIGIFNRLINWIFTILLILAIVFILMAAFRYLTAAGDDEKIKKAHTALIYAVVAIAVGLLAQGIRFIVGQLVGTPVPV